LPFLRFLSVTFFAVGLGFGSARACDSTLARIDVTIDPGAFEELIGSPLLRGTKSVRDCQVRLAVGPDTFSAAADIRIHGGASRRYSKKSFRVRFRGEMVCGKRLFSGFPSSTRARDTLSEVVLNANSIDFSNIRNYLSMYVAASLGGVAPRVTFAQLYVNREEQGLYSVIERVDDDMARSIVGHGSFDLIRSQTHSGNLSTRLSVKGETHKHATDGFSVKTGSAVELIRFVTWLESDGFSCEGLLKRCDMPSLYGHLLGCLFAGDRDAPTKNYYLIFDRTADLVYFVPWDSDATFGRDVNGALRSIEAVGCRYQCHGLYSRLMSCPDGRSGVIRRLREGFDSGILCDSLLKEVDRLEALLRHAVMTELRLWKDTLLVEVAARARPDSTRSGADLRDGPFDPLYIWRQDLNLIRDFIAARRKNLLSRL